MSARINPRSTIAGRVLVATDGSPASSGALKVAKALAARYHGSTAVIAVVERPPVFEDVIGEAFGITSEELTQEAVESTRAQVLSQIAELELPEPAWRLAVVAGTPAPSIVARAREVGASLIVLGLGRHSLYDRVLGTETALKVMALSDVPVLAVPATGDQLPRTAVVAVDFSEFSRDAALSAAGLLPPGAELHLAHVIWTPNPDTQLLAGAEWVDSYHQRLRRQLNEMAREIESMGEFRVHSHLLEGSVPGELLRLAYRERADLIAAGSHGASFIGRFLMGSVSTRLLRGASCAVLVAPPRGAPAELATAVADQGDVQIASEATALSS
jgi:nucleotide-binding universal stress UspA family protein